MKKEHKVVPIYPRTPTDGVMLARGNKGEKKEMGCSEVM